METKNGQERTFVLKVLPWIIGAAAFLVYLVTLNPWLSFPNTPAIARLCGWQWYPEMTRPAYFLATQPLHWLPLRSIPLALNIFCAFCGALAIGQLARSVALLPYDRTQEQRLREQSAGGLLSLPLAWIPPLVAALAAGLQLTFWDHATNGSPYIFDLLFPAYVIRVLLEYRNDGRESRLPRLAFFYGLGMTNDTAMIGFFPLFVIALLWLRRLAFFQFRFLLRITLAGLVGFAFCVLLPYLASRSEVQAMDFWPGLKLTWYAQKSLLVQFPRVTIVILSLTSLLPVFMLSIRWASGFGDNSQMGTALSTFVFHIIQLVLLVACAWTIFDSPFSPRVRGYGFPFLPFYYLAALSIGYFCGNFLLVFRRVPSQRPFLPLQMFNVLANILVLFFLAAVPVGLVAKNLSQVRKANGPTIKQFATLLMSELPPKAVLLSDNLFYRVFAQSMLEQKGTGKDFLPLDTRWLTMPGYLRHLQKRYGVTLPEGVEERSVNRVAPADEIRVLLKLAETNDLYYLQPSFGFFFEFFFLEPHGMVYKLNRFGTNMLLLPPLTADVVSANETFWAKAAQEQLPPVLAITKPQPPDYHPGLLARIWRTMRVQPELDSAAFTIGDHYSRNINYWGVEMQKRREFKAAGDHFQMALDLNPANLVAEVNKQCNQQVLTNVNSEISLDKSIEDRFGRYRSWDEILNQNGPFDEPSFCFAASYRFARVKMYRQSAQMMDRVIAFSPDNVVARLTLAQISLIARYPDQVLAYTGELRTNAAHFKLTSTNLMDMATLDGAAHLLRQDTETGTRMLESVANSRTNNPRSLDALFTIYNSYGFYSNALGIVDRQLAMNSEDVEALINKGYLYTKLKEYEKAIPPLTQALNIDTNNTKAMLNRAVAYLLHNDLDQSRSDYDQLQALYPSATRVYFGLAQIALERKDTNSAIANYEAYLTNALPDAPETKAVEKRLNELKGIKEPKPEKAK